MAYEHFDRGACMRELRQRGALTNQHYAMYINELRQWLDDLDHNLDPLARRAKPEGEPSAP